MKVICDRGALAEALNLVSSVVVARTPKPVLTCVKLTAAADGGLELAATDMEIGCRLSTPRVEVQEPGEAVVPADKLGQIVRESLDPTLTISIEDSVTHVQTQDAHFKVFGYAADDFPPVPQFAGEPDFELTAQELTLLITQTIYATARENSRFTINGVLLERDGNKLAVVATDGHRLAVAKGDCKGGKGDSGGGDAKKRSAIVPTKALQTLLKVVGGQETAVRVKVADNQILFATESATLVSNLVEGSFPPYKDVIPKDGDRKATLDTQLLASAVRRAALLTNEESKGVRLAFQKDSLILTSRAPEMGEAEIKVELPAYEGEPIEIGFNPAYVLDALKVVDTDTVTLDLKAPSKPGVLRSGTNFLYVVMPVTLQ